MSGITVGAEVLVRGHGVGRVDEIVTECDGHESTSGPIGNVVYCDGSCRDDLFVELLDGELVLTCRAAVEVI